MLGLTRVSRGSSRFTYQNLDYISCFPFPDPCILCPATVSRLLFTVSRLLFTVSRLLFTVYCYPTLDLRDYCTQAYWIYTVLCKRPIARAPEPPEPPSR